jgi:hypothetical protein
MSHSIESSSVAYQQPLVSATTRAIELALRPTTPAGDNDLRDAMRQLCADARRASMRPEDLIILFKATWRARTDWRTLPRNEANAALDHVITMCIEEYYGNGSGC